MNQPSILQQLLSENQWDIFQPMIDQLQAWSQWPLFCAALDQLDRGALYTSPVHGEGHIERTLLHGAFCAMADGLSPEDTALLLDACSYHDVGRVNDWFDEDHGHRSAQQLERLTGRTGDDLTLLQAIVDAHAKKDDVLEQVLRSYAPADYPRTLRLAQLLKDADGLDRVRIHDLNTKYLRRPESVHRANFAFYLFSRYELALALTLPFSTRTKL